MIPACAIMRCRPETPVLLVDGTTTYNYLARPTPYATPNVIFVMPEDDFFVSADENGDTLSNFKYVDPPVEPKNVLHLQFAQKEFKGHHAMMLTVRSFFSRDIVYHAVMEHPAHRESVKTSTCPLRPKITATELWPHPISLLLLRDFRFGDNNHVCSYY